MNCPECYAKLIAHHKYPVLGKRYGSLPGMVHIYWCKRCQQRFRYVEIRERDLKDWQAQWEACRQSWIRENARLEEKLSWFSQPYEGAERKLRNLRMKLAALMQETF